MIFQLLILASVFFSVVAKANICGTDFQNFNPTTNGLDFVTVQSSETLKPCIVNMGLFFNYAANTLSYSQNVSGVTSGTKANDRILGADIGLGLGLAKNWDIGMSVPLVLSQEIKDNNAVTYYEKRGVTEVKLNTKYRFYGDDAGGFAGIFSINNNLIENNPFSGDGAKPTLNFEVAADTTILQWALALNLGYRKRSPGTAIPNQPFLPLKDQWIYSAAASYLFDSFSTKLILELYGSLATNKVDYDADRSLNALEGLIGIKHDLSHAIALHFGGTTKIGNSIGSPDWRIYTGINWTIGPICKEPLQLEKVEVPSTQPPTKNISGSAPPSDRYQGKLPDTYRFSIEVLFDTGSDQIKSSYADEIANLMKGLTDSGFKKLEIDGHTDSVGSDAYNLDLSIRRANSVKKHLIEKYNFPTEKMETKGFGKSSPIADNGNYQGRQQNRRVEFKIWK